MPVEDLNCSVFEKREEKTILFLRERSEDSSAGAFVEKNNYYKREICCSVHFINHSLLTTVSTVI